MLSFCFAEPAENRQMSVALAAYLHLTQNFLYYIKLNPKSPMHTAY